jgi:hypothetical protein
VTDDAWIPLEESLQARILNVSDEVELQILMPSQTQRIEHLVDSPVLDNVACVD